MQQKEKKRPSKYRVYADQEGKVFLNLEPAGVSVEIQRPVTAEKLEIAREKAKDRRIETENKAKAEKAKGLTPAQTEAQKEIKAALHPIRKGPWSNKFSYVWNFLKVRAAALVGSVFLIALAYVGVQLSSDRLPEWLHVIVLCGYVAGLGSLLQFIATEESRVKARKSIIGMLGPWGMVILPVLILLTTAAVLASITFRLYSHGWIALETCGGRPISEPALRDFYVWHFVNIVPTLQLTKLLRMTEPFCYTQSRVGILIFAFQLLVVIPSFNTIRFYWKHRKQPGFVYDPYWSPPRPNQSAPVSEAEESTS